MPALPDPRRFAATTANPYSTLAAQAASTSDATQRNQLLGNLHRELQLALGAGREDLLSESVAEVGSAAAARILTEALDRAINTPVDPHSALAARVFAIPVVFVAGGLAGGEVSGIFPDAKVLGQVLETQGALGPARNFGVNPALCADTSVEAFSPSLLYALLRDLESGRTDTWLDLIPAGIELESAEESVHLRFVTGIVVTPAQAPSFVETAGDIGRWGTPFSRELIAQLGQQGLSLLPLPRPPSGLLVAVHEGRRAREEVAFQAFASQALRRLRSETGDPRVEVAALNSGAIGVRLTSPFGQHRVEAHRWQLDALDDLSDVVASILDLLAECRVSGVQVLDTLAPDEEFLASS
jgi:hypothetical protein